MDFKKTSLAISVSLALTACGGGGGGGSGGLSATLSPFAQTQSSVSNPVPFYAPTRIDTFKPHHQPYQFRTPLTEIHTQDINGDGSDEVLWSNVAFDWTGQNWIDSQVQIFGFNTGSFTNETAAWFNPGDNVYTGGFKINFGDFNASGFTDVFLASFTDTPNYHGDSILLENTVTTAGGVSRFLRREIDFGTNLFSHDSVVADFNGDGIPDVLTTGTGLMLGSATGNYSVYTTNTAIGSGLSAADYLGDGSITVVMTDGPGMGDPASDTLLLRPRIQNGQLFMDQVAVLPADRFFLPKWDGIVDRSAQSPHAVRSMTMDFDNNGKPDVVVFSTMPKDGNVHGWTEVQFLRNDGAGVFTDVTDTVLTGFDHGKSVTYNPQLLDVNNDGLLDIFMSTTDYTGQSSTSVLLATQQGTFVESYVQVFDAFNQQIKDALGESFSKNQPIAIVAGPNNTRYLISGVAFTDYSNDIAKITVYASLIGNTGTITPMATADAVRQVWPWLSDPEVNAVLAQSTTQWLNGVPILDMRNVMNPIGGLGITLRGSPNQRLPIQGNISIPGLDPNLLRGITAVDRLGRDFVVDLRSLDQPVKSLDIAFSGAQSDQKSWSSRFVSMDAREKDGVMAAGSVQNWTTGGTIQPFGWNSGWSINIAATQIQGSPWLSFSGVFGRVNSSTLLETSVIRQWSTGHWAQFGGIQTATNFTPGLVSDVSNIYSVFASAGWRDQNWNIYGGIQPYIVSGSVTIDLPGGVDPQGRLHYNQHTIKMDSPVVAFAGAERRWDRRDYAWKLNGVINSEGAYQTRISYSKRF